MQKRRSARNAGVGRRLRRNKPVAPGALRRSVSLPVNAILRLPGKRRREGITDSGEDHQIVTEA